MSVRGEGPVRHVVIVGGGTAGWMTAAALARLTAAGVSVTLIESEEIGTIGVGEATIPTLHDFNRMLGIDEDEFVRETQATFKLGIEFVGWGASDDRYIHPFGKLGRDAVGIKFHNIWLQQMRNAGLAHEAGPVSDYSISVAAARLGRFTRPSGDPSSVLASLAYAFHFDASLYARYLRGRAEQGGVARVEGRIDGVELEPGSGFVAALRLADGRRIDGELFIDCSGFRALVLDGALGIGFESWQHWLPCDRAIAAPCANPEPPVPYTRATADAAGWRWRIPLQHRMGNGYVYSSAHLDDDSAEARLRDQLEGSLAGEPRRLRFTAGRRDTMWVKNCVAIGLSAGFLEPLESTSIHLIQSGIARLLALFPDRSFAQHEIDEYNRTLILEYEQVRDFVILHYHATQRNDTTFWRHCRAMRVPDSLAEKLELWRGNARLFRRQDDLFTEDSWVAVLLGQNEVPRGQDPLTEALPADESRRFLAHLRDVIGKTAAAMPTHAEFIARHCAAPPLAA
jgi:tryptophan halogenase